MSHYKRSSPWSRYFHWLLPGLLCLSLNTTSAADTPVVGAAFDKNANIAYPKSHAIVDITTAP